MIIVQKYGGSSVADSTRLLNIANRVVAARKDGNELVVVVSAQGKTTDFLIDKAKEIGKKVSKRELDVLISTGEQQSMALLAMTLKKLDVPAISLTGEQAGIVTNSEYGNAKILNINPSRIRNELSAGRVVIVAGFQGVDQEGNITTLGRGGSDTTAVALALALNAERCEIYSDVDGVYTADPRVVKRAKKLKKISYDSMLELSSLGAKVLNSRSVALAKKYKVKLTSGTSFENIPGTEITDEEFECPHIGGFTADKDVCIVSISGVSQSELYRLMRILTDNLIPVDMLGETLDMNEFTFTVKSENLEKVKSILIYSDARFEEECAKVSMVGFGMINKPEVTMKIYEALYENNIKIKLIGSMETKFSVIVRKEDVDIALNSIHNKFIE